MPVVTIKVTLDEAQAKRLERDRGTIPRATFLRAAWLRGREQQPTKPALVLTREEAAAIYDIINELSGFNPENVFAWDGTDSLDDAPTRASAKLYKAVGRSVPEGCKT